MGWGSICKTKQEGGLGFKPLALTNKALIRKWLWRLGEEQGSQWVQVVSAKYGVLREGWYDCNVSSQASCIWRGVLAANEVF